MNPELNKKRKAQVKKWLERPSKLTCPFTYINKNNERRTACKVCARLFPEIYLVWEDSINGFIADVCPCTAVGIQEVIKRAKKSV